jgi:predicted alpha/beta-hydrolase family hydrolase
MNAVTLACIAPSSHAASRIGDVEPHAFDTPHGLARAYLHPAADARAALVLGHGAGGSVTAPDLSAARDAALAAGVTVVLVEQPYRVAGRRSAAPAAQLDVAWVSVVEQLRVGALRALPVLVGGRSSGARVACRTAGATTAAGVLCLAFPLQPAARTGAPPPPSRLPELESVAVPVLVVQGVRDPFGMPPPAPLREVMQVAGDHRLAGDLAAVSAAIGGWLLAQLSRDTTRSV